MKEPTGQIWTCANLKSNHINFVKPEKQPFPRHRTHPSLLTPGSALCMQCVMFSCSVQQPLSESHKCTSGPDAPLNLPDLVSRPSNGLAATILKHNRERMNGIQVWLEVLPPSQSPLQMVLYHESALPESNEIWEVFWHKWMKLINGISPT